MAPTLAFAATLLVMLPALTTAVPTVAEHSYHMPLNAVAVRDPAVPVSAASQIVGGSAATSGQFPYIVSISKSGSHLCGGVLINSKTVVTAAHCSVGQSASAVKVRAGTLTWASGGTQVSVSSIVVNPSYSSSTIDSDVAVWKLATAIPTSSTIGYATLPAQGSDPAAGITTTTAGWGTTSESSSSIPASLRWVSVPVVSRSSCQTSYGGPSVVTTNMFCAGLAAGGKDSCAGDSGGPIIDASTNVLIGVVSWGQGCAEAGYPGVYTRLGNFVNWINANLG